MAQKHGQDNNKLTMDLTIETDNNMFHIEDSIELEMAKLKTLLMQNAEAVNAVNTSNVSDNNITLITE